MKKQILNLVLIALVVICLSSCNSGTESYTFGETKIFFDPSTRGVNYSWEIKEITSSGTKIKYDFEDNDVHKDFINYRISPSIKDKFNSFVYPDSLAFEIMKERAEMWVRKIDSANLEEINLKFEQFRLPESDSIKNGLLLRN